MIISQNKKKQETTQTIIKQSHLFLYSLCVSTHVVPPSYECLFSGVHCIDFLITPCCQISSLFPSSFQNLVLPAFPSFSQNQTTAVSDYVIKLCICSLFWRCHPIFFFLEVIPSLLAYVVKWELVVGRQTNIGPTRQNPLYSGHLHSLWNRISLRIGQSGVWV